MGDGKVVGGVEGFDAEEGVEQESAADEEAVDEETEGEERPAGLKEREGESGGCVGEEAYQAADWLDANFMEAGLFEQVAQAMGCEAVVVVGFVVEPGEVGDGDDCVSAGFEETRDFTQRLPGVGEMMDYLGAEDGVVKRVGQAGMLQVGDMVNSFMFGEVEAFIGVGEFFEDGAVGHASCAGVKEPSVAVCLCGGFERAVEGEVGGGEFKVGGFSCAGVGDAAAALFDPREYAHGVRRLCSEP